MSLRPFVRSSLLALAGFAARAAEAAPPPSTSVLASPWTSPGGLVGMEVDGGLAPGSFLFGPSFGAHAGPAIALLWVGLGGAGNAGILAVRGEAGAQLWTQRSTPFLLGGVELRATGRLLDDPATGRTDRILTLEGGYAFRDAVGHADIWLGLRALFPAPNSAGGVYGISSFLLTARLLAPF